MHLPKEDLRALSCTLEHTFARENHFYAIMLTDEEYYLSKKLQELIPQAGSITNKAIFLAWLGEAVRPWLEQHLNHVPPEGCTMPGLENAPLLLPHTPHLQMHKLTLLKLPMAEQDYTVCLIETEPAASLPDGPVLDPSIFIHQFDFFHLVDNALSGVWYVNMEQDVAYASAGYHHMLGNDPKLNTQWQSTLIKEDLPLVEAFLTTLLESRDDTPHKAIFRHRHKDGHVVYVMTIGQSVPALKRAKTNEIFGFWVDVTEQEQLREQVATTKEQLKNREALYRQLIKNSNEYITIMDQNFSVEWASENFSKLLGVSNEQLLGKQLSTFAHPEDAVRVKAHFKAALERGDEVVDFEGRFRDPNGGFIWMKSRSVFLTDESGVQKIYTYRQDISREKAIDQKQQEMAKLKNEFVSMTSHQLRTPMAVFASNLELLETLVPDEQTAVRRILKRMNTESDRMVHLLDEVLLLSRLESGIAEVPKHKKYDIVELIRTFCEAGICNNTHMQAELPKGPIWASIDKEQFEHILMNLVSNAIKYTPAGRPKPDVSLHSVVDHAVLTIQDYGIGIPEEDQPRLFQQFVRAKNVSTIPGTGLGLYIVKRFADQNNIKITLKSQIKQGTTFYLNIPTL